MTVTTPPPGIDPQAQGPQVDVAKRTQDKVRIEQLRQRMLQSAQSQTLQFYDQAVQGTFAQDFPAQGSPVEQMQHVAGAMAYPGDPKDIQRGVESIPDPGTQQRIQRAHQLRQAKLKVFRDGQEGGRKLAEHMELGAGAGLGALRSVGTLHLADPGNARNILLSQAENYAQFADRAQQFQREQMQRVGGQEAPIDRLLDRPPLNPDKPPDERGWTPEIKHGRDPDALSLPPDQRQEAWLEGALQGYESRLQRAGTGERLTGTLSKGMGTAVGFLSGGPAGLMKGGAGLGRALVQGAAKKKLSAEVFQGTFGKAADRAVELFGTKAASSSGWRMLAGVGQAAGGAAGLGAYEGMVPLDPEEKAWAQKQESPIAAEAKLRGLRAAVGVAMYPIYEIAGKFGGALGNKLAGEAPSAMRRAGARAVEGATLGFGFDAMAALQDTPAFRGAVEQLTDRDPGVRSSLGRFLQVALDQDRKPGEMVRAGIDYMEHVGLGAMAPFALLHAFRGLSRQGAFPAEQLANWQKATEILKADARENFKSIGDGELMRFLAKGGNLDTLLKEQPAQVDIQHSPEFISEREALREKVDRERSLDERAKQIERYDPEQRSALGQEYRREAEVEKVRAADVAQSEEQTRAQQEVRSEQRAQDLEEGAPRQRYLDQESKDARRVTASLLEQKSPSWKILKEAEGQKSAYERAGSDERMAQARRALKRQVGDRTDLTPEEARQLESIRSYEARRRELDETVRNFFPEAEKQLADRARRAAVWEDYARRVDEARDNPDLPLPERPTSMEDIKDRLNSEAPTARAGKDSGRSMASVSKPGTTFSLQGETFQTVKQDGETLLARSKDGRTVRFPRSWFQQTPAIRKEPREAPKEAPARVETPTERPAEDPGTAPAPVPEPARRPAEDSGSRTGAGETRTGPAPEGETRVVADREDMESPYQAVGSGGRRGDVEISRSGEEHQAFIRDAEGILDTRFSGVGATLADAVADLKVMLERAGRPWELVPREGNPVAPAVEKASQKAAQEVERRATEKAAAEAKTIAAEEREAQARAKAEDRLRSLEGVELKDQHAGSDYQQATVGRFIVRSGPTGWGVWGKKGAMYLEHLPTLQDAVMAARIIATGQTTEEGLRLALAALQRDAGRVRGLEALDQALREQGFEDATPPETKAKAAKEQSEVDLVRDRVRKAGGVRGEGDALKDVALTYRRNSGQPIDTLADQLIKEGVLHPRPDEQPEDALARALSGRRPEPDQAVAERERVAREQQRSERDNRRELLRRLVQTNEDARRAMGEAEQGGVLEQITPEEHRQWVGMLGQTIERYGRMYRRLGPDDATGQWIKTKLDQLWREAGIAFAHPHAVEGPEVAKLEALQALHQKGLRSQGGQLYVPFGTMPMLVHTTVMRMLTGKGDPLYGDQSMKASRSAWSTERGVFRKAFAKAMGGPESIFGTRVFRAAVETELRFSRDLAKWSGRVREVLLWKPDSRTDKAMAQAMDTPAGPDKAKALENLDAAAIADGLKPADVRKSYDTLRDVYRFFQAALVRQHPRYVMLSKMAARLKDPADAAERARLLQERETFRREWGLSEYFTHVFEDTFGSEGFSKESPRFLSEGGAPTKVGMRFMQAREGAGGWIESAYAAFDQYLPAAIRKLHYDKLLKELDPLINGPTTRIGDRGLKALSPGSEVFVEGAVMRFLSYDPATKMALLEHPFTRAKERVKGYIINTKAGGLLKSGTKWVSKEWDNYRDRLLHREVIDATSFERTTVKVLSKLRGFLYHTTIGALNVKSAATNLLGGQFMALAELGPTRWAMGTAAGNLALHKLPGHLTVAGKKMDRADFARVLQRSGIMDQDILHEDVLAPKLQGAAHKAWKAVRQASFLPFSWAEAQNRAGSYLGGWIAAREQGASLADAHWAGVRVVERTQFIYSPSATPALFRSQAAKTVFQLSQYGFRFMGTLGREFSEAKKTGNPDRLLRFVATAGMIGYLMNQMGQDVSSLFGTKYQDLPMGDDLTSWLQTQHGMQPDGMVPWRGYLPGLQSPQGFAPIPKLMGELVAAAWKTTVNKDENALLQFAQRNKGLLISQSLSRYMQFAHLDDSGDPQAPISLKRPSGIMEALLPWIHPTGSEKERVTKNELLRRVFAPGRTQEQLKEEGATRNAHYLGRLDTQMRENLYDHLVRWRMALQDKREADAEAELGLARQIAEREGIKPDRQSLIDRWRKTNAPSYLRTVLQGGSRQQKVERVLEFVRAGTMTRQETQLAIQALRGKGHVDPATAKELQEALK